MLYCTQHVRIPTAVIASVSVAQQLIQNIA